MSKMPSTVGDQIVKHWGMLLAFFCVSTLISAPICLPDATYAPQFYQAQLVVAVSTCVFFLMVVGLDKLMPLPSEEHSE